MWGVTTPSWLLSRTAGGGVISSVESDIDGGGGGNKGEGDRTGWPVGEEGDSSVCVREGELCDGTGTGCLKKVGDDT